MFRAVAEFHAIGHRRTVGAEQDQLEQMQALAVNWTQAQHAVAAFIATLVPKHHDAEDILQRTAATLVAIRASRDPSRPFVPWAIGVARLEVLRYTQERHPERAVFDTEVIEAVAVACEKVEPDLSEMKAALDGCITKLRGKVREIFELHYVQGLTPRQIAEKISRSVGSVFLGLHRGRLELRQCMERSLRRSGGAL
jgi:RNA polymerase sigma-70 factor (ECF subfamily)